MVEQHGKTLVPQIRFAGFTDPWEQRKLGEFGSVAMCKRIYKEQTSEQGDVPFFKIGTFGANPDAFISNELFEDFKRIYSYPTPGTLLISAAGSIGRVVEYQGEKAYFQDSNIVWLEHDHRLNDAFLKPLYSRIEWGLEGSTIKRLYNKDLLSAEVTVPGGREQKEIGQFFAKLDSLITLHQRKYDKLCVLKKSMLDKMFPKGGSLYPEIRFAGFTDPWEQRKLGELYKEVSEKNDLTYGRDRIISVAHMYFNPVVYVTEDDYLKTYNVMRLGDIAFEGNRSKNFAHGRLVENTIGDGIVSHVFKVFRPIQPFDLMYWKYSINNEKAMKDVLTRSTKASTMMHELVAKDFLNEEIAVPSLEEQRRIGAFFDRLDSLITLHQRKYCGVASWMLGVALVRLGSESGGAFGEAERVLQHGIGFRG